MYYSRRAKQSAVLESSCPALLFYTPSENAEDVLRSLAAQIQKDNRIAALFPLGFSLRTSKRDGTLAVLSEPDVRYFPDQVEEGQRAEFYFDKQLVSIDINKRYADCRSFFKITGCASCPELGAACLLTGHPELKERPDVDREKMLETLRGFVKKRGNFLGYEVIPPAYTSKEHFLPSFRHADAHDFTRVDYWQEELSQRGAKAGNSRKFQLNECKKCPLNGGCTRFRRCSTGAYADEAALDQAGCQKLEEVIKNSGISEDLFWGVVAQTNQTGKIGRYNVRNCGWELVRDENYTEVFRVQVLRDKTAIRSMNLWNLTNPEHMGKYIKTFGDFRPAPKPSDRIRAMMYCALDDKACAKTQSYNTRVGSLTVNSSDEIHVHYYRPSYWLTWRSSTFSNWEEYARYYREILPDFMPIKKPKKIVTE